MLKVSEKDVVILRRHMSMQVDGVECYYAHLKQVLNLLSLLVQKYKY